MGKRKKGKKQCVKYDTIVQAVQGEEDALRYVVNHYSGYIHELSTERIKVDGRVLSVTDETLKGELEGRLMEAVMKFPV